MAGIQQSFFAFIIEFQIKIEVCKLCVLSPSNDFSLQYPGDADSTNAKTWNDRHVHYGKIFSESFACFYASINNWRLSGILEFSIEATQFQILPQLFGYCH